MANIAGEPAAHAAGWLQLCESSDSLVVDSLHDPTSSAEPMLSQDWALDIAMGLLPELLLLRDSLSRLRCRLTDLCILAAELLLGEGSPMKPTTQIILFW